MPSYCKYCRKDTRGKSFCHICEKDKLIPLERGFNDIISGNVISEKEFKKKHLGLQKEANKR